MTDKSIKDSVILTFDLKQKDLEIFYSTKSPENAYGVIRRFFEKNGLENIGDSDYISKNINKRDTLQLLEDFAEKNKWFAPCVKKILMSTTDQEWNLTNDIQRLYSTIDIAKPIPFNDIPLMADTEENKEQGVLLTFDLVTKTINELKDNKLCPSNPYEVIGAFLIEKGFEKTLDSDYITNNLTSYDVGKLIDKFSSNPDNQWFVQGIGKVSISQIDDNYNITKAIKDVYTDDKFVIEKIGKAFDIGKIKDKASMVDLLNEKTKIVNQNDLNNLADKLVKETSTRSNDNGR